MLICILYPKINNMDNYIVHMILSTKRQSLGELTGGLITRVIWQFISDVMSEVTISVLSMS